MATSILTNAGRLALSKTATAWDAATFKVLLARPTYTPLVTDATIAAASAYEISGTGYTGGYGGSGRKTLASLTVALDAQGRVVFDAADLTWTALDAGAVGWVCVVVETGGTDATGLLVAALSYPVTDPAGGDLAVIWPSTGLFYLA